MSNKNKALKAKKLKNNVAIVRGGDNGIALETVEYFNPGNKLKIEKSQMKISQKRKTLTEEDIKYGLVFICSFLEEYAAIIHELNNNKLINENN